MITAVPGSVQIFGVTLVGISATTGIKLLFTVVLVVVLLLARRAALWLSRRLLGGAVADTRRLWTRQGIQVVVAVLMVLGVVSVWVTPTTDASRSVRSRLCSFLPVWSAA